MTPDEPPDGRWLSYGQIAQMRGISRASAERMVRRHRWQRQPDNAGVTKALVPTVFLDGFEDKAPGEPDAAPIETGAYVREFAVAIKALREAASQVEARAARAEAQADRAEARADTERQRADSERSRAEALTEEVARLRERLTRYATPDRPWWRRLLRG